jgi:hypothetical protein
MAAGEPGILVDDRRQPFGGLRISPLPKRPERPPRADDRQIIDPVRGGDLGQLIGHSGAAGHSGDEAAGPLENAVKDRWAPPISHKTLMLMAPTAAGDLIGALDLGDRAVDRISDQFLVALAAGESVIDLRDDPPFGS